MTCIIGYIDNVNNNVVIGGDSAGSSYDQIIIRKDSKVFKVGPFVIGATSSFRMIQLLKFTFQPPEIKKNQNIGFNVKEQPIDIYQYMCTDFIKSLRECLSHGGFLAKDTEGREVGGVFLVAWENRLFSIESDFQVAEFTDGFHSVGSGSVYALGALKALQNTDVKLSSHDIVRSALTVAAHYSQTVAEPFILLET